MEIARLCIFARQIESKSAVLNLSERILQDVNTKINFAIGAPENKYFCSGKTTEIHWFNKVFSYRVRLSEMTGERRCLIKRPHEVYKATVGVVLTLIHSPRLTVYVNSLYGLLRVHISRFIVLYTIKLDYAISLLTRLR